jgi:hypothetical protein
MHFHFASLLALAAASSLTVAAAAQTAPSSASPPSRSPNASSPNAPPSSSTPANTPANAQGGATTSPDPSNMQGQQSQQYPGQSDQNTTPPDTTTTTPDTNTATPSMNRAPTSTSSSDTSPPDSSRPRGETAYRTRRTSQAQWAAAVQRVADQCDNELRSYCTGVPSGNGRVLTCLNSHRSDSSSQCQAALDKVPASYSGGAGTTRHMYRHAAVKHHRAASKKAPG